MINAVICVVDICKLYVKVCSKLCNAKNPLVIVLLEGKGSTSHLQQLFCLSGVPYDVLKISSHKYCSFLATRVRQ